MAKKKKAQLEAWCWYCDREFEDDKVLLQHQKAKHYKCPQCPRRLNTAGGLTVHLHQVHKAEPGRIENALPGRDSFDIEIYGMVGIPEADLEEWRSRRAANSSNGHSQPGQPQQKKQKIENVVLTPAQLKAQLEAHKALMSGQAPPPGATVAPTYPQTQQSTAYPGSAPPAQAPWHTGPPPGFPQQPPPPPVATPSPHQVAVRNAAKSRIVYTDTALSPEEKLATSSKYLYFDPDDPRVVAYPPQQQHQQQYPPYPPQQQQAYMQHPQAYYSGPPPAWPPQQPPPNVGHYAGPPPAMTAPASPYPAGPPPTMGGASPYPAGPQPSMGAASPYAAAPPRAVGSGSPYPPPAMGSHSPYPPPQPPNVASSPQPSSAYAPSHFPAAPPHMYNRPPPPVTSTSVSPPPPNPAQAYPAYPPHASPPASRPFDNTAEALAASNNSVAANDNATREVETSAMERKAKNEISQEPQEPVPATLADDAKQQPSTGTTNTAPGPGKRARAADLF